MDLYGTATELYTSSLRAMEQRSTAFLTAQSLLVAGFAVLSTNFQPNQMLGLFSPILIVAGIGLVYAMVFFFLHEITSKDTAYWRAYMRFLEGKSCAQDVVPVEERSWRLFYKCTKNQKGCCKLVSWEGASGKLPGPILWLGSPAIFCVLWIWLLWWIIQLQFFGSEQKCDCLLLGASILTAIVVFLTIFRYCKSTDNMFNKITNVLSSERRPSQ